MDFLIQLVAWAGPLGLFAAFIWFMCAKKGWGWATVITSCLFAFLLCAAVPDLPQATNDGITGFITAFTKSQ